MLDPRQRCRMDLFSCRHEIGDGASSRERSQSGIAHGNGADRVDEEEEEEYEDYYAEMASYIPC